MHLTAPNVCHGVMLSNDVFVTIRSCEPSTSLVLHIGRFVPCFGVVRSAFTNQSDPCFSKVIILFPKVLIGDYGGSGPLEASAQLRLVKSIARVACCFLVVKLAEPVTFAGFVPAVMNDDPSLPLSGESLTLVGYGSDVVPLHHIPPVNQTGWPGPALKGSMSATDATTCLWAFSLPEGSDAALFCGTPKPETLASAPCYGTPVLPSEDE